MSTSEQDEVFEPISFNKGDRVRHRDTRDLGTYEGSGWVRWDNGKNVGNIDEHLEVISRAPTSNRSVCVRATCTLPRDPGSDRCWLHKPKATHPDVGLHTWLKNQTGEFFQLAQPTDNVDHPSHYTQGGIETIDAIEAMVSQPGWGAATGLRLGNVLKYLWRHAAKGGVESHREIASQEKAQEKKP